ncbi:hypothetical protein POTOM_042513 [Populus tomentosa]|uniref:Uncharacterized protein n=1 Tax=Populus tomentosa TaxID=118781 RepID=A0A8X8CH51_POPTO|nr:hypothetical protein POTOM_042513 [Populus tomentosa]
MMQGTYSQYESYEDDGNIASYYRGSYESRNQGQHSGQAAGGSWPDNEVMARQLQEMSIYGEDSGSTAILGAPLGMPKILLWSLQMLNISR